MQICANLRVNRYICCLCRLIVCILLFPQDDEDKLTWKDRFPGYLVNFASILFMVIFLMELLPMIYACGSCRANAVGVLF